MREVKEREAIGYAYEGADASFELLARRTLGTVPDYFDVESFHVTVERRHNAVGKLVSVSEAVVKMIVGGERLLTVARATARSTRSTGRCARTSASTATPSPTSSWSTTRCVSSTAAPRR